jgi:hypothetical protein
MRVINDFILSLTLNEREGPFVKPINRVSLGTNSFITTYAILTLLRAPISRISI